MRQCVSPEQGNLVELALTGDTSTIVWVARYGRSDDFNNLRTTQAAYGVQRADSDAPADQSQSAEPEREEFQPAPWYRSPPLLIAWLLLVLILIALIVYGIGELIGDNGGTTPAPSSTTTSTTAPSSTTTPSTSAPPPSATTETTPPATASQAPPPTQHQPTYQPTNPPTPRHHPHLPTLPPGIHLPFSIPF